MNTKNLLCDFISWCKRNLPKSYRKYYANDRRSEEFEKLDQKYRESFGLRPFD